MDIHEIVTASLMVVLFGILLCLLCADAWRRSSDHTSTRRDGYINATVQGMTGPTGATGPAGPAGSYNGAINRRILTAASQRLLEIPNSRSFVLGPPGMGPWGGASGYTDDISRWIWTDPDAANSAPAPQTIKFMRTFTNDKDFPIHATLRVLVDNYAKITVNDIMLTDCAGWGTASVYNFTLPVGDSLIEIDATNAGDSPNPAGLCFSMVNEYGEVISRSDENTLFIIA